jgi:subtilisin family serine protease
MRPRSITLTILLASLSALSLSAQGQRPAPPQRGAAGIEMIDGREAAAGEVLLKLRAGRGPGAAPEIAGLADASGIDAIGRAGVRRLRSRSMSAAALIARLAHHPAVEYVEPNYIVHSMADPNDPSFPQLWGLKNVGQGVNFGLGGVAGADIHATQAWTYTTGSQAHVVAVIDTGVDYTHPDLAPNIWSAPSAFTVNIAGVPITCPAGSHGFNAITMSCNPMDDHNHGTHVSGTIGASGNNGLGVVGVNWVTQIMAIKFLDANGSGSVDAAINGIDFAIQASEAFSSSGLADVRVMSASWAGTGFSQALLDEILVANDHDVLFVAAAGNNAISNDLLPSYPASYNAPNIISVAATTNTDDRAFFSNYGAASVHLGAPGQDILSTTIGGTYQFFSGTSMATPHVSGAAALLLSFCPMNTAGLKDAILNTVQPVPSMTGTTITGGRLDVFGAVRSCVGPPDVANGLTAAPGDTKVTLKWASAPGATGFNVKRSATPGGPYALVAANVKARTYLDTAVANGTPYYYVVSGLNSLGEGPNSNEAFAIPNAPSDLVVSSLTSATFAGAGLPLSIAVVTTNQGPGNAVASTARFYLSNNALLDTADAAIGVLAVPALTAGASFSATSSVSIPVNTPPGLYYLFVKSDADDVVNETSDNNNTGWRQIFIGPDLVVTALDVPVAASSGADIVVSDAITNRGGGDAGASTTRYYLSTDVLLGANDIQMAAGRPVGALAPGAVDTGSATVTLPSVPAGLYFIIAKADGNNAVAECIEDNNGGTFRAIRIGGDLVVSSLTVPAKAGPGDAITVTDTTTNQGAGAMGASTVTRFYISSRVIFDTTAVPLPGGHAVPDLAGGASSTASTTVTLPSPLAVGTYYLFANADADNAAGELSETNNGAVRTVLVGGNLVVSALTAPATSGSGAKITVTDTTANQGAGQVAPSVTRFYLSRDAILDNADTALDGSRSVPTLATAAVSAGSTSLRLPDAVAPGAYFIIAKADGDGTVVESSETDNTLARPITIGPDLIVTSITAPLNAPIGATITVTDTVTNQGGGATGSFVVRYYLSASGFVNANARLLTGSRTIKSLAAGESNTGSAQVTLPADISGAIYLVAKADADGSVAEGQEGNNTRERVILILLPR